MRSVRPYGVERDWHATAWMAAGFGLAAMGGFVGSLLREREALAAARRSAIPAAGLESAVAQGIGRTAAVWQSRLLLPEAVPVARPAEAKA